MKVGRNVFYVLCFITLIYLLMMNISMYQSSRSDIYIMSSHLYQSFHQSLHPVSVDCKKEIAKSKLLLMNRNLSVDCLALKEDNCHESFKTIADQADPFSVFLRSAACQIDLPANTSVTTKERDFPLAFFITVFKDSRNLEQLLQTIFRPHNAYCIHVDAKSDPLFLRTIQQIVSCYKLAFPDTNIFISSEAVGVYWGHFSIVQAEIICLRELHALDVPWKYALNLGGSDQMLYTNQELVTMLSSTEQPEIYVESFELPDFHFYRIESKWELDVPPGFNPDDAAGGNTPMRQKDKETDPLQPVPFGIKIYKGKKSYKLPRSFVTFFLEHPVAQEFTNWSKDIYIPDESVIQSLARISTVLERNGTWEVEMDYTPSDPDHLQVWQADGGECRGFWRNSVCVFSLEDMSAILWSNNHIVNKFRTDKDPWVVDCLTEIMSKKKTNER